MENAAHDPFYIATVAGELIRLGACKDRLSTDEIIALVSKALFAHPVVYSTLSGFKWAPKYDPDGSLTASLFPNFQVQDGKSYLLMFCPITHVAREVSSIHFLDGGILDLPQDLSSSDTTRYKKALPQGGASGS